MSFGGDQNRLGIGPQYAKDDPLKARMRFHQSWWRMSVLKEPYGVGPGPTGEPYGNYLSLAAGGAGKNFLTPKIYELVKQRIAEGPGAEPYRVKHNLLSSQPMCFNLFAPLRADPAMATGLLRALLGDRIHEVTEVRIEYAPTPAGQYLGDSTSFDAFIAYVDVEAGPSLIGVETKLTEPFSQEVYKEASNSSYTDLTDAADSPWDPSVGEAVEDIRWNQLWRNQLLVEATRKHSLAIHGRHGRLAVIRHPLDTECAKVINDYEGLLKDPADLLDWRLDRLVETWRAAGVPGTDAWLAAFSPRYIDLHLSDEAWAAQQADRRPPVAE
jgi:hypothetical protein